MKRLPPLLCKSLFLISLGILGYEIQPIAFPSKTTVSYQFPQISLPEIQSETAKKEPVALPKEIQNTTDSPIAAQMLSSASKPKAQPKVLPKPVISLLDTASLLLVGNNASSKDELEKDAQLLEHAAYHGEWKQYRSMLGRSLAEEYVKIRLTRDSRRYAKLWSEPKFYNALLRWQALGKFPPRTLNRTKNLAGSSAMMEWLMTNNQALEEIILTVHANDDKDKAFRFLAKVWSNEEIKIEGEVFNDYEGKKREELNAKYFNLALASALVFDKPVAYKNPTSAGSHVDGYYRYHWYLKKNETGKLEGDIHRASAMDLTFVVCSPVSTSELEWALKKYRSTRRKNFGNAFSDVEYLMEKAVNKINPYEEYTLPEILKEGGICVDQTYFCVNTARAAGIPAFGLSGMTDSGAHAWAAVKIGDDEWTTNIGRIGGVARGTGRNPQTGESIIEQEVWMWTEDKHASRRNVISVFRNVWLANFFESIENIDEQSEALQLAHKMGPEFPSLWQKIYKLMLKTETLTANPSLPATLSVWKKFVKEMKHQFRKNPRMSSLAEMIEDKHIFPHSELSDIRRELARLRRRNTRNASEQADLQTTSLQRETELILANGDDDALTEIHQLYSRALREYGGSVSGFRDMIQFYFKTMKTDEEMAKKAVRTIELAFGRVVETGSSDWFRLRTEVAIHKEIAAMYREVGEEKRASNMEKKLERILKNADRKAL